MESGPRRLVLLATLAVALLSLGVVAAQSGAPQEESHAHMHDVGHYAHTALHASHLQHTGHASHGHDEPAHP